jgi:hypothetical protein
MAYGLAPWELEDWPTVWIARTLGVLEQVDEPPPFGELAKPVGGEGDQQPPA